MGGDHAVDVGAIRLMTGEKGNHLIGGPGLCGPVSRFRGGAMTATYTFDTFSSLDGCGSHHGDWGGYWGKQGPELLEHRFALYDGEQRMVFGANTYRQFAQMVASGGEDSDVWDLWDPWVTRMRNLPATVVSSTLKEPLDWPDATLARGDAVDVVARLKQESDLPLRSHGSLSLNRALMAAVPVITGQSGESPIFERREALPLVSCRSRSWVAHE
jgi:hypothetical protein